IPLAMFAQSLLELLGRHCLDGVVVERQQLVAVKFRSSLDDAIEIKALDEKAAVESFNVAAGRPAEQGKVVDQNLRQIAVTSEVVDVNFGQVDVDRSSKPLSLIQRELMIGIAEPPLPCLGIDDSRTVDRGRR